MASRLAEQETRPERAGTRAPARPRKAAVEPATAPVAPVAERPTRRVSIGTALAWAAAGLMVAAGVVHFAFAPDHIAEYRPFGIAFYAMGFAQVGGGLAVAIFRRSRPVLFAAMAGSLGIVALWLVTRTVGLPIGAETWTPEKVGVADVVCVAFQLGTALFLGVLLAGRGALSQLRERHLGWRTAAVALTALGLVVVPLTAHASTTGHEMPSAAEMPARG